MWNASFKLMSGCVVYICCVGFASLDVVCDERNDSALNVCSSFLISVCMFIVSNALFISSATVIVRAGGATWLNPFATVLFTVCSAVTVEYCVLYRVAWVCLRLCKEEGSSPVSAITERRDMMCPCLCLCWILGWGLC